jgi:hypothetical protein
MQLARVLTLVVHLAYVLNLEQARPREDPSAL